MASECKATVTCEGIQIYTPYFMKDALANLAGRRWNPYERCWICPVTEHNAQILSSILGMKLDPALKTMVMEADAKSADEQYPDDHPLSEMLLNPGIIPFKHQIRTYNYGINSPVVAIMHEQGAGKTITAIAIMAYRAKYDGVKRILIVCPVSVIPVWEAEIKKCMAIPCEITVLQGSGEKKAGQVKRLPAASLRIIVANYESLWRDPLDEAIRGWKPQMVVADESQRIKDHTANQSRMMHDLGRIAKYKLTLSGTPIMNSPLDLWSQYRFLSPETFGGSFYSFKTQYAIQSEMAIGDRHIKTVVGYRNLDDFVKKAHSIASRVTKAQCLDLPETTDQILFCELEPKARRAYRELQREMATEIGEGKLILAQHIVTRLLRLSQITGGFVNTIDSEDNKELLNVSNAKLNLLGETLDDLLDAGKKVVVFARFRGEIGAINEMLTKKLRRKNSDEPGFRLIWGDTKMADRGGYVRDFQENPDVRVFIAQIATAGLGITLTAADTAIFYSLDYSYANHEQAKARIHRIGQRNACTYLYLLARDTIDDDVLAALQEKQDVARLVVDEWRTLLTKVTLR